MPRRRNVGQAAIPQPSAQLVGLPQQASADQVVLRRLSIAGLEEHRESSADREQWLTKFSRTEPMGQHFVVFGNSPP